MKHVTLQTYREDKYYACVVRAVARILMRWDVVAPVDVLLEMGNLSRSDYDAWRAGRVPCLESVFEGNLAQANRILRIIGFHVHDLDMIPVHGEYRRIGSSKTRLRFSKSGQRPIEEAYAMHYKWNKSAEKKWQVIGDAVASLDNLNDAENEGLWLEEAERRYQEYKKGNIRLVPLKRLLEMPVWPSNENRPHSAEPPRGFQTDCKRLAQGQDGPS